jgi:integrase
MRLAFPTILTFLVEKRGTHCSRTPAGVRDTAIISGGYDTLCRSANSAAMKVAHVKLTDDGTGRVLIPRTKADLEGEGRVAYLAPKMATLVARWLDEAKITDGALFRALHLQRVAEGPLSTSSIRRLMERTTERAEFDPSIRGELSGHSMRIGAAQDIMVAGFDALAIKQAGGWKSPSVVLRYVEYAATRELHERRWALTRQKA